MIVLGHRVAGRELPIHFVETEDDLPGFIDWLGQPRPVLGVDTETTGLGTFTAGFAIRVVSFGDRNGAWIIPARFRSPIRRALLDARYIVMHNATYDLLAFDVCGFATLEEIANKTIDTRILSHIIDPRGREEGGTGQGLKDLAVRYIDPEASDGQKELKAVFAENKWKGETGWQLIPEDHPTYVRYAGLDSILAYMLYEVLVPLVYNPALSKFEHKLMRLLARLQRRGVRVDVGYLETLHDKLEAAQNEDEAIIQQMVRDLGVNPLTPQGLTRLADFIAAGFGTVPPKRRATKVGPWKSVGANSNDIIVAALLEMGEELTERTKKGKLSIDKDVLNALCDVNKDGERLNLRDPNPLAVLVKQAKRASKWRTTYVDAMLNSRDSNDRVHPVISGLQARTARMSVSAPPFQQLPSRDPLIRDGIIADPGHLIIASDYDQVELRILAALAEEPTMQRAIANGVDLHDTTAALVFGPGFTKNQRKLAKIVGFGKVYGGGAKGLSKQSGAPVAALQSAIAAYDDNFPGIKAYSNRLMREAKKGDMAVYTPLFGRRLPLDEDRTYAALNYVIQSTARDVFAQSLIDLDDAGYGDYLLMPVHDEIIAQAPIDEAEEVAKAIGQILTRDFNGVPLSSTGEVYGERWGDGYR